MMVMYFLAAVIVFVMTKRGLNFYRFDFKEGGMKSLSDVYVNVLSLMASTVAVTMYYYLEKLSGWFIK